MKAPPTNVMSAALFTELRKICHGGPRDLRLAIFQMRDWLTSDRASRPAGYMNRPKVFSAYAAYHLPLHLPELFWILDNNFNRLNLTPPKIVRDLGCGPGTNSLSLLLWLSERKLPAPEKMHVVDLSSRAVEISKQLINKLDPKVEVRTFVENIFHHSQKSSREKADWLLMGHVFNEMGNGPRYRDKKMILLQQIIDEHLKPGGILFLIDPPLREPTLDLMAIRDLVAQEHSDKMAIIAPCPRGARHCPMLTHKLGWCYAQPPRDFARDYKIAPWDREIESTLDIDITDPGFSYLVIQKAPVAEAKEEHCIAISDNTRSMVCTGKDAGRASTPVPFRGAYLPAKK